MAGTDIVAREPNEITPRSKLVNLSAEKREVAELLATKGMTVQKVSEETGVPISAIKKWKKNPDFIKYMQEFILDIADGMRAYRLSLCLKMLDARIEKIEEIGDYSLLSSKDTLDILESMRKDTEKQEDKEQTQYMKTIEALITKSRPSIAANNDGGN